MLTISSPSSSSWWKGSQLVGGRKWAITTPSGTSHAVAVSTKNFLCALPTYQSTPQESFCTSSNSFPSPGRPSVSPLPSSPFVTLSPHPYQWGSKPVDGAPLFKHYFTSTSAPQESATHQKAPPASFTVPVISLSKAQQIDNITLPESLFGSTVRQDLLHRVVTWHLSSKRRGTAYAKNRSAVVGSGRKIQKQKGTGRARVGQIRSPVRRGGGAAHGPKPRDWYYPLPKKIRQLALKSALSAKFAHNQLFIIDETELETHKTKDLMSLFQKLKWDGFVGKNAGETSTDPTKPTSKVGEKGILIVDYKLMPFLQLAHRNIPHVLYYPQEKLTVYDILQNSVLVIHRSAIPYLIKRTAPKSRTIPSSRVLPTTSGAGGVSVEETLIDEIKQTGGGLKKEREL